MFEQPTIYLITKGEATDSNLADARRAILNIVRVAVDEKVSLIQIREKKLSARSLFELTVAAAALTRGSLTRLLVNDRADIAFAAKADGVHLPPGSLPAVVVRKSFPGDLIIGVSTHSLEATADASRDGADFALFGPVFETPGKGEPRGLKELRVVCDELRPFPVIGVGGIDENNWVSVLKVGASGIAAIRWLNDPSSLQLISGELKK